MTLAVILVAGLCLAYANGANDNFKGVATLLGSGTTDYRRALLWAGVTTFLGSLTAVFLAEQLLKAFSGKGLVDASLTSDAGYVASVALGAGLTVFLATRLGLPISTTHSLLGALIGAGWMAGSPINLSVLSRNFMIPLLLSPALAILAACVVYGSLHGFRGITGITRETCFCLDRQIVEVVPVLDSTAALRRSSELTATLGGIVTCQDRYRGTLAGIGAGPVLDWLHYLSAGAVGFARGLNDTPKIAALLLVMPQVGRTSGTALVGIAMAAGGLLDSRKIADIMSRRITTMNHGQGFSANLVTSTLVILASTLGLPVSTTHVSCGALIGIGTITGQARWRTVSTIAAAWLGTLPLAALMAASCRAVIGVL